MEHRYDKHERVQLLMGTYGKDGMAKKRETIPNQGDKSRYSCERYQFFLDSPFEISNICCNVMKKAPFHKYEKKTGRKPITALMAQESKLREEKWVKEGCNAFDAKHPMSSPMMFWTEQDVLFFIKSQNIKIASIYGDIIKKKDFDGQMDFDDFGIDMGFSMLKTTGVSRTGCMFCLYGIQREKSPNRLERMKETHPKIYEYLMKPESEGGMGYKDKIDWINQHGHMNIKY